MTARRIERVNSLLKEVISDVVRNNVKNPHRSHMVSITRVDTSKDLHYAKVYISVIGTDHDKTETMKALASAAGFIAVQASKQVRLRYFPELRFILDDSAEQHARIEKILNEIHKDEDDNSSS